MTSTLREDVDTLLDLLAMLPPFQGDLDGDGAWDPTITSPEFWMEYVRLYRPFEPADPEWITYMDSKIGPHVAEPPQTADDAAHLATYVLMFFAVTTKKDVCALLGKSFTPTFDMPDGDAVLGQRWVEEVVTVAWRIYRSVGTPISSTVSLAPGRTVTPTTQI